MSIQPRFLAPDGEYRAVYDFSTTISNKFFRGKCDPNTAYMQVSVYGRDFEDNPDLITFEGSDFTIPNPSSYSTGFRLFAGANEIRVRSILTDGTTTEESVIRVNLIQEINTNSYLAPTGVRVERGDGQLTISAEISQTASTSDFIGMNFYASTESGGGNVGYYQVNPNLIDDVYENKEETSTLGNLTVDTEVLLDGNGNQASDPLYFRFRGSQEDNIGQTLQAEYNQRLEVPESVKRIRTSTTIESLSYVQRYAFTHNRQYTLASVIPTIPYNELSSVPSDTPLYYVVGAVYYDQVQKIEYESAFSVEVTGIPLNVTTRVANLPSVSRRDIVRQITKSIYQSNPNVAVQPGSVLRDTFIDPLSSESVRLRFILDFFSRAQSFSTLLEIDDPQNTGFSVDVNRSQYKQAIAQAFYLTTPQSVQNIIDSSFDKLANNLGVRRLAGTRARGEVTFYVTRQPSTNIVFPIGTRVVGGTSTFQTTSYTTISVDNLASLYNPSTGYYETTAFVECLSVGTNGNLSSGQIRQVNIQNVFVANRANLFGGSNGETNRELAIRTQNIVSSVDTGTLQGYKQLIASIGGVAESKVVSSGNALMLRDYDTTLDEHKGGKVDVYVRGVNYSKVTDNFAFSFRVQQDIIFETVGDPQNLIFQARDFNLSPTNPIIEMLDFPSAVPSPYGLRNHSKGYDFVLTDVVILSYNRIQLSNQYNDPADIDLTDVVMGDYRYRTSNTFTFTRQPVFSLDRIQQSDGTSLDFNSYSLYRKSSILDVGHSTYSDDYLQIVSDTTLGRILTVTNEEHILVGSALDYLRYFGVNALTIVVTDSDGVEYQSPSTNFPDYRVIVEDQSFAIQRTENSQIPSGSTVLISYQHDENFTVTYTINSLLGSVQNKVDNQRHITADIVVKESVRNEVDVSATIILKQGFDISVTDTKVRTRLFNFFNSLSFGDPIRQSDLIEIIDNTEGVSYVVVPLTKMARGEGSLVVREMLDTSEIEDVVEITNWETENTKTFLIKDEMNSVTTNGGGSSNDFRGVFKNNEEMELLTEIPNSEGVPFKALPNRAFIIGNSGLSIKGYNDLETLRVQNPSFTDNELYALQVSISRNRVLITLPNSENPTNSIFQATYFVGESVGTASIEPNQIEYLVLGQLEFIYDTDSASQRYISTSISRTPQGTINRGYSSGGSSSGGGSGSSGGSSGGSGY